jgi:DNA-binding NarL/FixJ family response regulator
MELKVLILEDVTLMRMGLTLVIKSIDPERMKRLGISGIKVDTADCAAEAYALLESAEMSGEPYDVLILDLGIPYSKTTRDESRDVTEEDLLLVAKPEIGMDVLRYVKRTGAAKEVIVYSAYSYYKYVAPAFRLGVVDFIAKGRDEKSIEDSEPLQKAVLAGWERVLARESERALEERFKTLVPYAEQVLTYQLSKCFSRLIQSISHEVEAIKTSLTDRLGLDAETDAHDPLLWHLVTIQRSVQDAKAEWGALPQARFGDEEDGVLKEVVVEDELNKIVADVLPSLTLKHANAETPSEGQTRVLSFAQDVPTILREIIIGGLGEVGEQSGPGLAEPGRPGGSGLPEDWNIWMNVKVSAEAEKAEVRFEDNLRPIDLGAAESINKGLDVALDNSLGRVWGLSVAQHAALRGGGRLVVEPTQEGNVISFFVPLKY